MKKCLLHSKTFARIADRLKPFAQDVSFVTMDDEGAFLDVAKGAPVETPQPDIVFGNMDVWEGPQVPAFVSAILGAGGLDWFQSSAAGVDHPVLQKILMTSRAYTANHTQAEAMAEWALWQALDFFRKGPVHRANQAAGAWVQVHSGEIMASHWLVYGYGAIGQAVARRVEALGGHVTGVRRTPGPAAYASQMLVPGEVGASLGLYDVVLLCAPLTQETANLAGPDFFVAMKLGALFMNLGRGGLVDEEALLVALDTGAPAHAALDVTVNEPLPSDSAFWHHPQVSITPHDSTHTEGSVLRADEVFLANLERYVTGAPLLHIVRPEQ